MYRKPRSRRRRRRRRRRRHREHLTTRARIADLNRDFARNTRPSGIPGFQEHPSGLVKPAGSARISGSAFIGHGQRKRKGRRMDGRKGERSGGNVEKRKRERDSSRRVVVRPRKTSSSLLRFRPLASSHTDASIRRASSSSSASRRARNRNKNTQARSADRSESAQQTSLRQK